MDEAVDGAWLVRDPSVRQLVSAQWKALRKQNQERFEALAASLPDGVRGETHHRVGRPAAEVVDLAKDFDGIVVATHGREGLPNLFLGSIAEKIVHATPGAVWVLRFPPRAST